jgi:glycosyltransferase involved in cell wall biosynthesis
MFPNSFSKNNISVSIIIPIYNCAQYLEKCLNSVINQTLKDIQIICINDASKDNSLEILKEFCTKDQRIEIVNLNENKGQSFARNLGLDIAKGNFIGFVDADDFVDLDYFEKLYNEAIKNDCEIVMAGIRLYKRSGKTKIIDNFNNKILSNNNEKISHLNNGSTCTKIFSHNLISKYNIRFPEDLIYEDNVFLIKAVLNATKICTLHDCLYNYINQPQSTMQSYDNQLKKNTSRAKILEILIDIFSNFQDLRDGVKYNFIYKSIFRDIVFYDAISKSKYRKYYFKIYVAKIISKLGIN